MGIQISERVVLFLEMGIQRGFLVHVNVFQFRQFKFPNSPQKKMIEVFLGN